MIKIQRYEPGFKGEWDSFVELSKNGLFLFKRNYMDYHSDRFTDHSLIFAKDGSTIALLPANISDDVLFSHSGLTFGGLIFDIRMKQTVMMELFKGLLDYLRNSGISKMVYKAIPAFYHIYPSQEDIYALFLNGGSLMKVEPTSVIDITHPIKADYNRRRMLKEAEENHLNVSKSDDYASYMEILSDNLRERHGVKPVHTFAEISLLKDRFPDNIMLYTSEKEGEILAGTIIYLHKTVAHCQYIASTKEGRRIGALDLLFNYLIRSKELSSVKFLDFGISTEEEGRLLNEGLISFKQGFGARTMVHETYQVNIK